jgi:putative phosphotransacetylase
MDTEIIKKAVRNELIKKFAEEYGIYYVPVAVSNRHVHLSRQHVELLFGKGYRLHPLRPISQPGQYACEEKIILEGPKGAIKEIRVLGPERKETQVEVSITDTYILGIKPVVRMSGDICGTPGGRLIGPKGQVEITHGVIISARHLHLSDEEAGWFGLKNGDKVKIRKAGIRGVVFHEVVVRSGPGNSLDLHIDTDECNAAGIKQGELLLLER